jgi:hypothetical protein
MKKPYKKYTLPFSLHPPIARCDMSHLLRRVDRTEVEREWFFDDPRGEVPKVPFGHFNAAWKEFLYEIYIDCELWEVRITGYRIKDTVTMAKPLNPAQTVRGYAVVQRGLIIADFFP